MNDSRKQIVMAGILAASMTCPFAALAAEGNSQGPREKTGSALPLDVTAEQQARRMAWWDEATFGMFIHCGVYSVAGGEWKGKGYGKEQRGSSAEWLRYQARIPKKEVVTLAEQFNPVQIGAEAWVLLARKAGMKYINITAKHHDGFALCDSKVSDFDVMDATPFNRDILKELAEACGKHGLKPGFYYSHNVTGGSAD